MQNVGETVMRTIDIRQITRSLPYESPLHEVQELEQFCTTHDPMWVYLGVMVLFVEDQA